MLQNIHGLVGENTRWKINHIKDIVENQRFLIMNFTETWLNDTVKDDVEIEGYKMFRKDRKEGIRGGVAIYLHDSLEAEVMGEMSHKKCEILAVHIKELNIVNIVIYRPPDTEIQVFEVILKELKKILEKMDKPDPTVILSGDFNFPFVNWKRLPIFGDCEWEYKSYTNATKDQKAQFENLMKVCDSYSMLQTIEEATRKETTTGKENTLDLLFTNEIEMMGDVDANDTPVSDHKRVEIDTGYSMNNTLGKRWESLVYLLPLSINL